MGCDDLLVVVDHKPLVKLLGDRRLDEINNPRLFRIKQRTLMWRFQIEYQPGIQNHVADAVSRRPNKFANAGDRTEEMIVAGIGNDLDKFFAITWEVVQAESRRDQQMSILVKQIAAGFPSEKGDMSTEILEYWEFRHSLNVVDGVVLYNDRIVVPCSLRKRVLENLHSAHQGITSMTSRAMATVFWPGITAGIESARDSCRTCHRNAPSQAKLPPVEPKIPKVPFEMICSDYFKLGGYWYLVTVDRLSGWCEVVQVKSNAGLSGAKGLCQALRQIFATFGVPEELSSDGGPEFTAQESKDFYQRWGVRHRLSSAYFPQSNGRAELAVKATKRLIEDNLGPNGELNTDKLVCALLQQRNTPDRDCLLSPADILFGRPLRDGLPQLDKSKMIFDNHQIHTEWRQTWAAKEAAIRSRLVRNCEKLESNSRELDPLREGDSVFVQNQDPASRRSKKWDRQGTVVATGDNDQYLVRVAGTGRLTLRNRRFLRKFQERAPTVNVPVFPVRIADSDTDNEFSRTMPDGLQTDSSSALGPAGESSSPPTSDLPSSTAIPQYTQQVTSANDAPATSAGDTVHDPPTSGKLHGRPPGCTKKASRTQQLLRNLLPRVDRNASSATSGECGEQADTSTSEETCSKPGTEVPSLRRSGRVKTAQKFYDASTGR